MYGKFGCGVTHEQAVEEFNGGKTVVQMPESMVSQQRK